jgi:molybdopterin-guanine dinucleotide biosynthesis protein A
MIGASAILAGGKATRMGGRQKALLEVGGRPILDRQLDVLPGEVFVVGATLRDLPRVDDPVPGAGPLVGILAAILHRPRVLVVACDMPYLSAALIEALDRGDADAVVPVCEGRLEPLCAVYTRACEAPIRRAIAAGDLRATAFHADVRVTLIEHDDLRSFTNCNHAGDLL